MNGRSQKGCMGNGILRVLAGAGRNIKSRKEEFIDLGSLSFLPSPPFFYMYPILDQLLILGEKFLFKSLVS